MSYAAILALEERGSCDPSKAKLVAVENTTLEALAKHAENLQHGGRRICSITVYNLEAPETRELYEMAKKLVETVDVLEELTRGRHQSR